MLHATNTFKKQFLEEATAALNRIEKGTFGCCEECGKTIPVGRLEVLPYTRFLRRMRKKTPEYKGNKTMIHKKANGKKLDRSRLSLAARMLCGAVPATMPVPPPKDSWRNKNLNSKNRFKR